MGFLDLSLFTLLTQSKAFLLPFWAQKIEAKKLFYYFVKEGSDLDFSLFFIFIFEGIQIYI